MFAPATINVHPTFKHTYRQNQLGMYNSDLARTYAELDYTRARLEETYMATLEALAAAVDTRDPYTHGHCRRVARITTGIAKEMGISDQQRCTLERAALLHDIGKIGVPDSILLKTTHLSAKETETIRAHPEIGFRMLSGLHFLDDALLAVRYHHERLDGSGYPYGLAGDQIPLIARVLAVADAYDAMTSDRPYRQGVSPAQGLAEIERCSGTHFDPLVVAALVQLIIKTN